MTLRRDKILFIAPSYTCGARNGGSQRTTLLYRSLTERYDVDALIIGSRVGDVHRAAFPQSNQIFAGLHLEPQDYGIWKFLKPVDTIRIGKIATAMSPRRKMYAPDKILAAALDDVNWNSYQFIVGRYFRPVARTGVLDIQGAPPVLIDVDDRDDLVLQTQMEQNRRRPILHSLLRNHKRQIEMIMAEKLPHADHLWLASNTDLDDFTHPSISLLPNIPFYPSTAPASGSAPDTNTPVIFFIGGAGHEPNFNGMVRFINTCWPAIRRQVPLAQLRIIGGGWGRRRHIFKDAEGFEIVGRVDDVADEYAKATVAIAPVNEGGGTKIKVLEALNFNVPVVTTEHSARGFEQSLKAEGLVVAANDAEMIEGCVTLLRNPEIGREYARRGRKIVEQFYTYDRFRDGVLSACKKFEQRAG